MTPLLMLLACAPSASASTSGSAPAVEKKPRRTSARTLKGHGGRRFHLDLEAQTNFPIDIGGRVSAEFPFRLRLSTSLGAMPGGYVDVINAIIVSAQGYDEATAAVIEGSLSRSLVWRTHLGWRPLRYYGLYVEGGYGMVTLGGSVSTGDALAVAAGTATPVGQGRDAFDIASTLHMLDIEVGYQFLVWKDHLSIRTALGYAGTMGATTRATATSDVGPRAQAALDTAAQDIERYLDEEIYEPYVHTGVITVTFGYRFF